MRGSLAGAILAVLCAKNKGFSLIRESDFFYDIRNFTPDGRIIWTLILFLSRV
jgi:hypothetical protein